MGTGRMKKNIEGTEEIKNGETKHAYVMSGYLKKFEVKTIELNNSGWWANKVCALETIIAELRFTWEQKMAK